jgi:hypothetical protein
VAESFVGYCTTLILGFVIFLTVTESFVGGCTTLISGFDSRQKFGGLLHNSNIGICLLSRSPKVLWVVARL